MPDLLIVGPLSRDLIRSPAGAWWQPGGAPWHAGLALSAWAEVAAVGQAGPWLQAYALPGLTAAGIDWRGQTVATDTAFLNASPGNGRGAVDRRQRLLRASEPLDWTALRTEAAPTALVSPLFSDDGAVAGVAELAAGGAFVAVDAQGLLRQIGPRGQVRRRADAALWERTAGAQAVKFSLREFVAQAGTDAWREAAEAAAAAQRREVLVTRGAEGVFVATPGEAFALAASAAATGGGRADTTGAGDVFLAAYALVRSGGGEPREAAGHAVEAVSALLRDRAGGGQAVEISRRLRDLHRLVERMRRAAGRGAISERAGVDVLAALEPLRTILAAYFSQAALPVPAQTDALGTAAALVGVCWAALARGWPAATAAADVAALAAAVGAAREAGASHGAGGPPAPGPGDAPAGRRW